MANEKAKALSAQMKAARATRLGVPIPVKPKKKNARKATG